MPKYSILLLKLVCLGAGIALLLHFGHWFARRDAVAGITIPPIPSITNALNEPPASATNVSATSTSRPSGSPTNVIAAAHPVRNSAAAPISSNTTQSGVAVRGPTAPPNAATSSVPVKTNLSGTRTNPISSPPGALKTNVPPASSTNLPKTAAETNAPPPGARPPGPQVRTLPGGPGGMPPTDLPPLVKTRVDRIVDSEILGPVMRPLPMALLGIAGKDVFLRAPNGQTGLIKEGDSLGGVKLLKIGVNRVLVDEEGQSKELTIFSGFGGETLMSNSTTNQP